MIRRKREQMQISEAELRAMTADMVEMHNATFPQMRAELSELGAEMRRQRRAAMLTSGRRRFLLTGGGLVVGSMVLAACGGGDEEGSTAAEGDPAPAPSADTAASSEPEAEGSEDSASLMLNASLENLAVFAYGAALEAAPKGQFGKKVPPAVAEFATNAMKQHKDHAEAFNAALKSAGGEAYTETNPALTPAVKKLFGAADSIPKLAMLALTLENTAGATYVKQMGVLTSADALSAVATIAPVERQHAAILSFILGEYPVPDTFVKFGENDTSLGARTTADIEA